MQGIPSFIGTLAGCTHPERAPRRRNCALLCGLPGALSKQAQASGLLREDLETSLNKVCEHALARRAVYSDEICIATLPTGRATIRIPTGRSCNLSLEPHVSIARIFAWRNSSGRPPSSGPRTYAAAAFGERKKLRVMRKHAQTAAADNLAALTPQLPKTPASCGAQLHSSLVSPTGLLALPLLLSAGSAP